MSDDKRMNVNDEAVEAAARWLWEHMVEEYQRPTWEDAVHDLIWNAARKDTLVDARELLEAAAPHLTAPRIVATAVRLRAMKVRQLELEARRAHYKRVVKWLLAQLKQ